MNRPTCHACGQPDGEPHDEDCIAAEHQAMLAGDERTRALHDAEACEECLLQREIGECRNRCGNCCSMLLVEATELDARREPKILEQCPPYRDEQLYLLNSPAGPCRFLRRDLDGTAICGIYATRPLACRLFSCDRQGFSLE